MWKLLEDTSSSERERWRGARKRRLKCLFHSFFGILFWFIFYLFFFLFLFFYLFSILWRQRNTHQKKLPQVEKEFVIFLFIYFFSAQFEILFFVVVLLVVVVIVVIIVVVVLLLHRQKITLKNHLGARCD